MLNYFKKIFKKTEILQKYPPVIHAVRNQSLTYLEEGALNDIFNEVNRIEKNGYKGILIEAGCALGGSAIVIANAKNKSRPFYVYDVFSMIPPPSQKDGADIQERYNIIESGRSEGLNGNTYYGYEDNLLEKVKNNFTINNIDIKNSNIKFIQGLFEDTLLLDRPVALAHIDGDWYSSVITCLQKIEPWLISGGIFIIDDYYTWSGCKSAVDEYFHDKRDKFLFVDKSRLHIMKK